MLSISRSIVAALLAFVTIGAIDALSATVAHSDAVAPLPRVAHILADGGSLKVVALGSSSTEGIGASSPAASYPSQLGRELTALLPDVSSEVLNRGIGGQDADDMIARIPAVLAERPDLVIWQTGSNDPLRGVPLERFVAETTQGIETMRAAGVDVILMEPQYCRKLSGQPGADRYRDAVRRIGAEMNVPVINRYDMMQAWLDKGLLTPGQMLSADGLHMADGGYAQLAKEVARGILRLSADSGRIGTSAR